MSISEKAAQKLKDDLVKRFLSTGLGFRIASDGNEHISIGLDRQGANDKVMETGGIRILLDYSVADLLDHYDLDYADGGFCLKNQEKPAVRVLKQSADAAGSSRTRGGAGISGARSRH
jgi:Fe-S cluster assembly iron-binding protein IscA